MLETKYTSPWFISRQLLQEVVGVTDEVVVSHWTSWKQFWVQRRPEEAAQLAAQLATSDTVILGDVLTTPKVPYGAVLCSHL